MSKRTFKLPGIALLVAVACANPAQAAYTTQTVNLGYVTTNLNTNLTFNQFDPLLGTLNSVVATFSGDFQNKLGFMNLGSTANFGINFTQQAIFKGPDNAIIHTSGALSNSFNQVVGAGGAYPVNFSLPTGLGNLNPLPLRSFAGLHAWSHPAELALFTGLGMVSMPFAASAAYFSQIDNGFGIVLGQTAVQTTVELAYNYAAAVPEAETYLMLLAGLSVTWLRFRRSGGKNKIRAV
ncbi:MAG: choice-of-anchor E domain-containing protein [Burkholderiales bacterium]|nr:choice-of-anchor E domain-containing protein [Burkholderiales bacterium]